MLQSVDVCTMCIVYWLPEILLWYSWINSFNFSTFYTFNSGPNQNEKLLRTMLLLGERTLQRGRANKKPHAPLGIILNTPLTWPIQSREYILANIQIQKIMALKNKKKLVIFCIPLHYCFFAQIIYLLVSSLFCTGFLVHLR